MESQHDKKAERANSRAQTFKTSGQGVPSPQGDKLTQLASIADNSPQAVALEGVSSAIASSPVISRQRKHLQTIQRKTTPSGQTGESKDLKTELVQRAELANGTPADKVAQRVVINTGHTDLVTELKGDNGWIIASDIQVALEKGGYSQRIFELAAVPKDYKVGKGENIYLVGHGRAGLLGSKLPSKIAPQLNHIMPGDYTGQVESLSCSAGVAVSGVRASGVVGLAKQLVGRTIVIGADGVALNHPAYPNGRRVIPEDKWSGKADKIVDKHIQAVHDEWKAYVDATGIYPSLFKLDAAFATLISDQFYKNLESDLEAKGYLKPAGADVTKAQSGK